LYLVEVDTLAYEQASVFASDVDHRHLRESAPVPRQSSIPPGLPLRICRDRLSGIRVALCIRVSFPEGATTCFPRAALLPDTAAWLVLAAEAAAGFGTPCLVSRWRPVQDMVSSQERRFRKIPVKSWLSFKTHPVHPLARAWLQSGRGVEVVSEAEFLAVRRLGCPADQLLVNGVAKHTWLGRYHVPALRVHLDSPTETTALLPAIVAQRWRVGLRCHVPAERDARDARFGGQFGLSEDEFLAVHAQLRSAGVLVRGVHFHLGQGTRPPAPYADSVKYIVELCRRAGLAPIYIDCGGGIDAAPDVDAAFDDLVTSIEWARCQLPGLREVWLENGRYLTRASAALVLRVLDLKVRRDSRYLICDGGRTNHALDADNGMHRMLLIPQRRPGRSVLTTITGPTCMTDDRLGRLELPDSIVPGDLIVWLDAGAYHLPWETRFSHGLCTVVWADGNDTLSLARARETPDQWSDRWTATS
jgi:diaminopimelate decarboxylase